MLQVADYSVAHWEHANPFKPGTLIRADAANVKFDGISENLKRISQALRSGIIRLPDSFEGNSQVPEKTLKRSFIWVNEDGNIDALPYQLVGNMFTGGQRTLVGPLDSDYLFNYLVTDVRNYVFESDEELQFQIGAGANENRPGTVVYITQRGDAQVTITNLYGVLLESATGFFTTKGKHATAQLIYQGRDRWVLSGEVTGSDSITLPDIAHIIEQTLDETNQLIAETRQIASLALQEARGQLEDALGELDTKLTQAENTLQQALSSLEQANEDTNAAVGLIEDNLEQFDLFLSGALSDIDGALDAIAAQVSENGGSIVQLNQITSEQAQSISALTFKTDESASHIVELQQVSEGFAQSISNLSVSLGNSESAITNLQQVTGEHATQLSQISFTMGDINSSISSLQTATAEQASSLTQVALRTENAESSISNLQQTSESQALQVTELTTKSEQAASSIVSLQETTSQQAQTITELNTEVDGVKTNITSLQQTSGEYAQSIQNLTIRTDETESSITTLQQVTADQSQSLLNLQTGLEDQGSQITQLDQTTSEQASRLTSIETTNEEQSSSIQTLEQTSADQAQSISNIQTQGEGFDSSIQSLQQTTGDQALQIGQLNTRAGNAESQITNLQSTTSEQAQSITELSSKAETAESNITTLQQTTGDQATTMESLESRADSAESEIVNLQQTSSTQATQVNRLQSISFNNSSAVQGLQSDGADMAAQQLDALADYGLYILGAKNVELSMAQAINTLKTDVSPKGALAQQLMQLDALFSTAQATNSARLTQLQQAIVSEREARAFDYSELEASFNTDISAAVTQLAEAISNEEQARAQDFSQLHANLSENYATLTNVNQIVTTEFETRASELTELIALLGDDVEGVITEISDIVATERNARLEQFTTFEANVQNTYATIDLVTTAIADEVEARTSQLAQQEASYQQGMNVLSSQFTEALSTESQARATQVNETKADLQNEIGGAVENFQQALATEQEARGTLQQNIATQFENTSAALESLDEAISNENSSRVQSGRELRSLYVDLSSDQQSNAGAQLEALADYGLFLLGQKNVELSFARSLQQLHNEVSSDGALAQSILELEAITNNQYKTTEAWLQRNERAITDTQSALTQSRTELEAAISEAEDDAVEKATANATDLLNARVGYCVLDGQPTGAETPAACSAAGGEWVSAPLAEVLRTVRVTLPGGGTATVSQLAQAFEDKDGQLVARGGIITDNAGRMSGVVNTNTGETSQLDMIAALTRIGDIDEDGNYIPLLSLDAVKRILNIRAQLILGDGHTVSTIDDIRAEDGKDGRDGQDGATGPQGVPGEPGKDGVIYYTWIRYADGPNGEGISNDPTGKAYMGLAYNKTSPTESNNPDDYGWTRFRGEDGTDGVDGPPGKDGEATYTWIAYSDNSDGSDMYQVPNENTKYIGIAVNKDTPSESSNPDDYTWSKFRGEDGQDGLPGADGKDGADGAPGAPGAGFFSGEFSTINWGVARGRFRDVVGRWPIPGDIFVMTTPGGGFDARKRNAADDSWVAPGILLDGDFIASGTVGARALTADAVNGRVIHGSLYITSATGSDYFEVRGNLPNSPPFGAQNNLYMWYGRKTSQTWNSSTNEPKLDGLTTLNSIEHKTTTGERFFGGTFQAGTLSLSRQTTNQNGSMIVETGTFTIPGNTTQLSIASSLAISASGLGEGQCPSEHPSSPVIVDIERLVGTTWQSLGGNNALAQVTCSQEGPEHIVNIDGGVTATSQLSVTPGEVLRLRAVGTATSLPTLIGNTSVTGQRSLSIVVSGA